MPVASYQQQNDYNLVKDIRPFDLPYASTMQEIAQKTEYFKIGVKKVQDAFQTAAGLEPQYKEGQEYLKGFLTQAQQNLEKISKSDLSVMDNAQQATKVFAPLFDTNNSFNRALLTDSQLNLHYKKQEALAEAARTKNNGKDYNQNNEIYFRDAQQKYLSDAKNGNYSTIDQNYQNKKSYVPYYDYKKELTDIQEACKGASVNVQDVSSNPLYFNETKTKGCDPEKLQLAYQTGLSDRARQQMNIDGYAIYRGDPSSLVKKYVDIKVNGHKQEVDLLQARLTGLKAGKITSKEQAQITQLEEILAIKKPMLDEATAKFNEMTKGNPEEYVKNNFDELAGAIHFQELTSQLGEAFRTDEKTNILKPNAVAMQNQKYLQDVALSKLDFSQDVTMAAIKDKYTKEDIALKATADLELAKAKGDIVNTGTVSNLQALTPKVFDPKDAPETTENDFRDKELAPAQAQSTSAYNTLGSYILKKYGNELKAGDMNFANLTDFVNSHNSKDAKNQDPTLKRLYDDFAQTQETLKSKINTMDAIDQQVRDENKELFNDSKLDGKPLENYKLEIVTGSKGGSNITQVVKNPPPLSEKDMYKILSGETVKGFQYKDYTYHDLGNTEFIGDGHDVTEKGLFYNGKRVDDNPFTTKIGDLARITLNKYKDNTTKISEAKAKLYADNTYSNGNYIQNTLKIKKDGPQDQNIRAMLGITGGQGEKNGYAIVAQTGTGEGTYFQLLDEDGKVKSSDDPKDPVLARLGGFSAANTKENVPGVGNAYKVYGISERIAGLPSDAELSKFKETETNIRNIARIFKSSPAFKTGGDWVESSELPGGRGIIESKTNTGRPVNIVIRKEGNKLVYVGTIKTASEPLVIEANSTQELITILNSN